MNIDELTLGQLKEIAKITGPSTALPFEVGQAYFIRTLSYHMTGRVTEIVGKFLKLSNAAWIADSGRFMQAIKDGELSEVEPVGEALLNTDSVVDAFPWKHALPEKQK